jgi:hypothetical protein
MCIAVTTTWINTGVTPEDIRRVFYRQPCLVCILAKRNKDSKLIWARRQPQPLPPAQPPPLPSPSPPIPPRPDTKIDTTMKPPSSSPPTVETERNDSQWEIGECISYDNVGPISPESIEGTGSSSHFATPAVNTSSATRSRLATRTPSSTISSGYYDSSPAGDSNLVSITTQPSAQPRPTNFMRTISAVTKAPRLTNNGGMRWSVTFKQSYPTSQQPSTDKTSCAPTSGPTP